MKLCVDLAVVNKLRQEKTKCRLKLQQLCLRNTYDSKPYSMLKMGHATMQAVTSHSALKSQKAVSAYFTRKLLLSFDFVEQHNVLMSFPSFEGGIVETISSLQITIDSFMKNMNRQN